MSPNTYNALTLLLLGSLVIALVLAVAYLVAAIVGWRGPHRKRRLVRCAIFLGAIPLFGGTQQALLWGVFLPSLGREAARQRHERVDVVSFVHVGDPAPPFTLTDTNGREFVLEDQRGKVVVVSFFATWCGPCLQELPHLQKLWDDHRDTGDFAMIVIGREETKESIAAFQSEHGYSFPMASDHDRSVYSLYAKELIPRTYLISRDGKICFASTGFDEEEMARLQSDLGKQLQ